MKKIKHNNKILIIWKLRMRLKRSHRLRLSLKSIGNMKSRTRIKLSGLEVKMISRKKNITSFTRVYLMIRMILLLILILRLMEE